MLTFILFFSLLSVCFCLYIHDGCLQFRGVIKTRTTKQIVQLVQMDIGKKKRTQLIVNFVQKQNLLPLINYHVSIVIRVLTKTKQFHGLLIVQMVQHHVHHVQLVGTLHHPGKLCV